MPSDSRVDFWTAATAAHCIDHPGPPCVRAYTYELVAQHGESHSAEHAGGETVSVAITTVLSRRSAQRVSLQILQR